ncbi:MAG: GspE/PulE family protein [Puniceicoccales bacterium]|jgi:type IV pilus assembly protein PilB|nr:GspE/PulE family protein [Puniceicoccales bacterium]
MGDTDEEAIKVVNADLIRCLSAAEIVDSVFIDGIKDCSPSALNDRLVEFLRTMDGDVAARDLIGMDLLAMDTWAWDSNAMDLLGENFALGNFIAPISVENGTLTVAIVDPFDVELVDRISQKLNAAVALKLTSHSRMRDFWKSAPCAKNCDDAENRDGVENERTPSVKAKENGTASIEKFFENLIAEAVRERASDIHLENTRDGMRMRIRVDGSLHAIKTVDKIFAQAVIARIKISADAKIDESRLPQDKRMRVNLSGKNYDLRVSILPTVYGENIAIRIFDQGDSDFDLGSIGLPNDQLVLMETMINCKNGLILLCGPTGCGKTTTLYTILKKVSSRERKVVTIEDPVEYRIDGINQIPVNDEIGLSFASILRSVLRQSPNVIMVGEIRDGETAELAIQAALTGHLVFSTIHCDDSSGAITRLLDFGISDHLIGSCLRGAISQKLVRKPCPSCVTWKVPSDREKLMIPDIGKNTKIPEIHGCENCSNRGYKGRVAIFDFLVNGKLVNLPGQAEPVGTHDGFLHVETFVASAAKLLKLGMVIFDDIFQLLQEPGFRGNDIAGTFPAKTSKFSNLKRKFCSNVDFP